MMTIISPTITPYFTASQTVDAPKKGNDSLCNRIKSIALKAFRCFVYFLTCTLIDWREKELFPGKTTLEYMQHHHRGLKNRLTFKANERDFCAWYSVKGGKDRITIQPKFQIDHRKPHCKTKYYFNEKGDIVSNTETITNIISVEKAEADTKQCVLKKFTRDIFSNRVLFCALEKACKRTSATKIVPSSNYKTKEERDLAMRNIVVELFLMESQDYAIRCHYSAPESQKISASLSKIDKATRSATLEFTGKTIPLGQEEKYRLTINIDSGSVTETVVNGTPLKEDAYIPELTIWPELLHNLLFENKPPHKIPPEQELKFIGKIRDLAQA